MALVVEPEASRLAREGEAFIQHLERANRDPEPGEPIATTKLRNELAEQREKLLEELGLK